MFEVFFLYRVNRLPFINDADSPLVDIKHINPVVITGERKKNLIMSLEKAVLDTGGGRQNRLVVLKIELRIAAWVHLK